ncbi:hypothetical protein YOLOSWAG_273 [Erwinia phage vB_EamM_Yoloswag]|uniref:Uncharacterized protein n=1 Tax=Erwinia phage vB_EamM_Yoloswag TaxID=1958956 RepID=A0A1S6L3I1_9CAUD|nr:hypothetical protein HOR66_gp273 [Erwinia phage vB_EamM_Yoloswag]AQT28745.1 hypothetical protein YOLOSWAG_273 [Erwinia phage vB_EamM_Yoloswag]
MKQVAQFQGHEVTADGVLVEVVRAFGQSAELLAVFDEDQLREVLGLFGTAPSNVRDCNRLELLYLLSNRVRDSDDALRVAAYVTHKFGASEDDDVLLPLCEGLIDHTSYLNDEDADDEDEDDDDFDHVADDEEDQTNCDSCGDEFDAVGRCSCATSYDFDEDEEHAVIKPKDGSQVLEVNYVNAIGTMRDDVVLALVPFIVDSQGGDVSVLTAQEVRLWLQQAKSVQLRTVLRYVRDAEGQASDAWTEQNPNLFSERHAILLTILSILHPQDPPSDDDDQADDENYALAP